MSKVQRKHNKRNAMHYGNIIFIVGGLIALIAGFFNLGSTSTKVVVATLIILGIVIGFLNIRNGEAISFMIASIALVILLGPFLGLITQYFVQNTYVSSSITKVFGNIVALIVPAAIVVALKTIVITAKDEE